MAINREKLLAYVRMRSEGVQRLFFLAEHMAYYEDLDDMSEEFQIATSILDVFEKRAADYWLNEEGGG